MEEEKKETTPEPELPRIVKTSGQEVLETKLKDMTPAQREQLEKLKVIMQEKADKEKFKANLRQRELQKREARRKKAEKVAKKQRKINRKRK